MKHRAVKNHLRTHRRKSALSQRQVGELLGYPSEAQVSRHENAKAIPHLASAFGYHIIFRVPLRCLFPGLYEEVRETIEKQLRDLEVTLHGQTVRGPQAEAIARTLLWMMDRRERDTDMGDAA
jgi:transcriptional regulator with XRE-family HTH domain